MRKRAFALILLSLLLTNNSCTNNEITEKNHKETVSSIIHDINTKLEKNSISHALIKKYKLKGEFNEEAILRTRKLAFELNVPEEWLYRLFYLESRGNPQAVNRYTGATGLIQIMPSTAKNLKLSLKDLYKMNVAEQIEYSVEPYLKRVKGNKHFDTFLDLYFAVFYPAAINKSDDYILGLTVSEEFARKVARQNKGIDNAGDGDGYLSVFDVSQWIS